MCTKFVTNPHRTNCTDMTLKDPAVDVINVNCCYVSQVLTMFGALCIPNFVSTSSKPLCFTSFSSNCDWNQKSDIFREHKYICFRVIIIQLYGIRIIFSDFGWSQSFHEVCQIDVLGLGGFRYDVSKKSVFHWCQHASTTIKTVMFKKSLNCLNFFIKGKCNWNVLPSSVVNIFGSLYKTDVCLRKSIHISSNMRGYSNDIANV